jgi:predicted HTH domain antitoxin
MPFVVPDEVLQSARMSGQEMGETLALALFEREKLTLGQAARLAGMTQVQFQHLLSARKIAVHYDVPDFEQDIATLKAMGRL